MYSVQEALARFFPAGGHYDRGQAARLVRWLDKCGYEVVRKVEVTPAEAMGRPLPECLLRLAHTTRPEGSE
jgi:hypothetical protein